MSNIVLDPGAGGATLGTDTVSGIDFQKVKIAVGADGTVPVSVSSAAPLPVTGTLTGISGNVTVVQGVGANLNVDVANFPGTQPISGTTTANQGTPAALASAWPVEISNGTVVASIDHLTNANALTVAIVDGSGNQITSFGGSGGNAAASATGSGVPLDADYQGWNSGGNLVGTSLTTALPVQPGTGATFPVSGTVALAAGAAAIGSVTVTGTVPVSAASLPLPTGAMPATGGTVGLVAGVAAIGSVTVTGTPAISGTVTANQGTANTAANAWPAKITDGTNVGAVKAASTAAVAADPAQVVAISPNNAVAVTIAATVPVSIAATLPVTISSGTVTAVTAITNALPAGANTIGKVDILGNAGAIMDAVITAATAPANGLATLVECVTTPPALTTGQSVMAQCDYQGNLFVQPYRRSNTKAATGSIASTTAATMLAAQASGIFADLATLDIAVGAVATTADAIITVNISDGTVTYKFPLNTGAITTVANVNVDKHSVHFWPPLPATAAATAWTIALSVANTTVFYTAAFVLQKAS